MRRTHSALLLAVSAAIALAGCATPPATTVTSAGTAAAGQTSKQRAEADVASILRSFAPPPGAQRLAKAPDLPGGVLKQPITFLASGYQAGGTAFWRASGEPTAVLAWEAAHLPRRFTLGDRDSGPPAWDQMFQLPPVSGVLVTREMIVEVASLGNGETGIRVDAIVGWQPPRPASDMVPSSAQVVTITQSPSLFPNHKRPPKQVIITEVKVVRELAALVNALLVSQLNGVVVSCPAPLGGGLRMTFRATPGGPALALVQTDQACGVTSLTVGGSRPVQLNNASDKQILTIARLHWTLPKP